MSPQRDRLLAARTEARDTAEDLQRQIAEMVAASEADNADDEHDPEGSTIAFERAQAASVLAGIRVRIEEIDAALQRESTGDYAVCTGCGGAIGAARLAARPATTRCLTCAAGK